MKTAGGVAPVEGDLQPSPPEKVSRAGTWRIYCAGVLGQPCPGRVWWYHACRLGRPVERCPRCRREHLLARKRDANQAYVESGKRQIARKAHELAVKAGG